MCPCVHVGQKLLLPAAAAGAFVEARQRVDAVLQQRQRLEDAVEAAQQQLHQVSNRMDDVQQQIADCTDRMQGSVLLQRQRAAVKDLKAELQQMELRLGLLAHQLVKCKTQQQDQPHHKQQKMRSL